MQRNPQRFSLSPAQRRIVAECDAIRDMLLAKNRAYGESAFKPLGIFAKLSPDVMLRARIDDKLARIASGRDGAFHEDTILDLIGYLILLRVFRKGVRR